MGHYGGGEGSRVRLNLSFPIGGQGARSEGVTSQTNGQISGAINKIGTLVEEG